MDYVVIASRTRTGAIKISKIMLSAGVENKVINTPKEAGVGCGLSVAIRERDYKKAQIALYPYAGESGYAFFSVKESFGKRTVKRI